MLTKTRPCPAALISRDGLIPAQLFARLSEVLAWVPMYFLNRTQRDPDAHPLDTYWYYPLVSAQDKYQDDAAPQLAQLEEQLQPVAELWSLIRDSLQTPVRLYECEYTANGYGNEGHPHFDSPRVELREQHIAAIVYCNPEWKIEWAGETVAFDESENVLSAVLPKPARISFMHGDPYHVARGVARICPQPRRVLVYKMWRLDT